MPVATYEQLLVETIPQAIETGKQYRETGRRFGDLVGKGCARTRSETKLMRLLALLIEEYDRRSSMPLDDAGPAERLRFFGAFRKNSSRLGSGFWAAQPCQ
jgi:hypothetical protein